jgi:hypothetical protein
VRPFQPRHVATVNIDVSSSNQRVQLASGGCERAIRVMNNGTATVWIEFGNSAVTAALASGIPIGPGGTEILTGSIIGPDTNGELYVAAIAAGSTGKIYFTPGDGI